MTRSEMIIQAKKYLNNNAFEDIRICWYHNDESTLFLSDIMVGFAKKMIEKEKNGEKRTIA